MPFAKVTRLLRQTPHANRWTIWSRPTRQGVRCSHGAVPCGDRIILEVVDNGRGLGAASERGMGLDNMPARAAAFGGELLIGPGPAQHGTAVRLAIPVS